MMKKIQLFTITLILLAVGCTNDGNTGTSLSDPYIGGNTGLLIKFVEESPPDEVYAGGDFYFDVLVELENEGEYDISKEDVIVTLSGINAEEFGKEESELTKNPEDDLEARQKENGDILDSPPVYVEFTELNRMEDFSGNLYTIRADVCYKYGTNAISNICIKSDNLDDKDGVCTVNEEKKVYSSSGPVQITGLEENARAKDKIGFTFTVEHKGNGNIYMLDSDCGKENRRANQDKVYLSIKTGLDGLECSGLRDGTSTEGYVTLHGGDRIITCTQTVDTSSDYEKPVEIEILYEYEDNAETTVLVKSSGAN